MPTLIRMDRAADRLDFLAPGAPVGHDLEAELVTLDEELELLALFPDAIPDDDLAARWRALSEFKAAAAPLEIVPQGRQLWIPTICRAYGLQVVEVAGWQTRGSDAFRPDVTVLHHTGGPTTGDLPTLWVLINGWADLPGPLCNVALSRSGVVYVVAAGRANHAGQGGYRGRVGNSSCMGIEAENSGSQPWPQVQVDAYYRLAAALQDGMRSSADLICRHGTWTPRKPDPHTLRDSDFHFWSGAIMYAHKVPGGPLTPEDIEEMPKPKDVMAVVDNPGGPGYYKVEADGGVQAKDGAPFYGSWFNVPAEHRTLSADEWFVGLAFVKDSRGKAVDYKLVTNKGDEYNPNA